MTSNMPYNIVSSIAVIVAAAPAAVDPNMSGTSVGLSVACLTLCGVLGKYIIAQHKSAMNEALSREKRLLSALETMTKDSSDNSLKMIKVTTEQNELIRGMRHDLKNVTQTLVFRRALDEKKASESGEGDAVKKH